jgi:hypothetical protein
MYPDFVDLLRSLLAADVRFMIVGAYAVSIHGRPRATKDLDVWVEPSVENAPKVIAALRDFGAPLMGLTAKDLETPEMGLQIGNEPVRIDILTKISGPSFAEAWPARPRGRRCARKTSRAETVNHEGSRTRAGSREAARAGSRANQRISR